MIEDPEVFVIEDDASMRAALRGILEAHGYATRVYAGASEFLKEIPKPPAVGCLLVDMRMPQMDGMALLDEVRSRGWSLPLIFLTGYGTVATAVKAIKGGALEFLEKPTDADALVKAVTHALEVSRKRQQGMDRQQVLRARVETLSDRERQILALVGGAMSSKSIARELKISQKTVEKHRENIMKKLNATGAAELVRLAVESGIVG
jgi:two-component system response regulator FixJ